MNDETNSKASNNLFLILGLLFVTLGLSGNTAFLGVGTVFLIIGLVGPEQKKATSGEATPSANREE